MRRLTLRGAGHGEAGRVKVSGPEAGPGTPGGLRLPRNVFRRTSVIAYPFHKEIRCAPSCLTVARGPFGFPLLDQRRYTGPRSTRGGGDGDDNNDPTGRGNTSLDAPDLCGR
jgi:hypothetical protein